MLPLAALVALPMALHSDLLHRGYSQRIGLLELVRRPTISYNSNNNNNNNSNNVQVWELERSIEK